MAKLADEAARAELAALVDGPWRLRWYWRSDLEAIQNASRAVGHPDGHPAAEHRHYQPTDTWLPHPYEAGVTGRVWRYLPTPGAGGQ